MMLKCLGYPANNSSPPSEDNTTFTYFFAILLTKVVGIAEQAVDIGERVADIQVERQQLLEPELNQKPVDQSA